MRLRQLKIALRLFALTVVLALLTFAGHRLAGINATTAGFIYLLAVLFAAAYWGLVESIFASVVAVLLFNYYFLPPIGTLTISDPQNWIALLAFLATAVIASKLSDTVKRQAAQAIRRQREMEQLYSLSRSILLLDLSSPIGQQLAVHVSRVFEAPAVALYEKESGLVHWAGPEQAAVTEEILRESAIRGSETCDQHTGIIVTAIRLGAEPIGSMALQVEPLSDSALHGLVNLVAIGIERARSQEQASRLEVARQNDELKSVLLDAIAHEFKTPLTSIKVASTALLADDQMKPDQTRELITVVDEEANRLRDLVTQAIQMARIEPGRVKLNPAPAGLEEIIADAANKGARFQEGQLLVTVDAGLPVVNADRELIELALRQLIDNAVKYSTAGSRVRISASRADDSVVVSVEDEGRGVPEAERARIFERFYRSRSTLHNLPGAGLGLAIARDIVQAHGGTIWMEPGKSRGSVFSISLPLKGPRTK